MLAHPPAQRGFGATLVVSTAFPHGTVGIGPASRTSARHVSRNCFSITLIASSIR